MSFISYISSIHFPFLRIHFQPLQHFYQVFWLVRKSKSSLLLALEFGFCCYDNTMTIYAIWGEGLFLLTGFSPSLREVWVGTQAGQELEIEAMEECHLTACPQALHVQLPFSYSPGPPTWQWYSSQWSRASSINWQSGKSPHKHSQRPISWGSLWKR